jgi:hypothetical protein
MVPNFKKLRGYAANHEKPQFRDRLSKHTKDPAYKINPNQNKITVKPLITRLSALIHG